MRRVLAILIACQLLLNSGLALAHVVGDAQDPHESVHAHAGIGHHDNEADHSVAGDHDHDGSVHLHLCVFTFGHQGVSAAPLRARVLTPYSLATLSLSHAPPVPPPNY